MLVPFAIPLSLLALYVLLASAAFSDQTDLLCARQRPAQLHIHGSRYYQQHMPLQAAIESASPELLLAAAFTSSTFKYTNTGGLTYGLPRINSTQLAYASDGLWSERSQPVDNQGETLDDGLISGITGLDRAKADGDSEETSAEQQHNDATNAPDEEECPTGFDNLDCEDCGGPEHTWEVNPWHFLNTYVISQH